MNRRGFLKSVALGAVGLLSSQTLLARERLHALTMLLGGESTVKGARPIPPFTPFSMPEGSGLRFLVLGDWGTGGKSQRRVARSMVSTAEKYGCDYVISTGDNIYPKGVRSAEDKQWKQKFTSVYHDQGLTQPFFPTLGNHDYGYEPDAQIAYSRVNEQWRFPSRYYTTRLESPDGSSVQLYSLDTQLVQTGRKGAADEQREWLDAELSRSTATRHIVFGHHMLYSNGGYGNLGRLRSAFEDVLVKHKVDLYLCGHDHDIQLLQPVEGVSYLVSGGGGGHRNTSWRSNTIYAATNMGYVWLGVSGEGVVAHFHDAEGTLKYAHRIAP